MNSIIITGDGSHTIYNDELNEPYHSVHGALAESQLVFLKNGFEFCKADPLHVFEVGFGTGLNALLTALKSIDGNRHVYYTSIEKYPLADSVIKRLNYHQFFDNEGERIFGLIHSSPWNERVEICRNFTIEKIKGDFTSYYLQGNFDLIYFDAFGPDKQPDMWTSGMFSKISGVTGTGGIFVTYSVKGEVKRNLRACGFNVTLLPGPQGKRQILRAIKN